MTLFDCQNLLVKCVAKQYVSHYANKGRIVFRAFSSILSELKLSICSARNYLNLLLQDVILHVQLSQWLIVQPFFEDVRFSGNIFLACKLSIIRVETLSRGSLLLNLLQVRVCIQGKYLHNIGNFENHTCTCML